MSKGFVVEECVVSAGRDASAVEAVEAYIQAVLVVNRIETLRTIFSIDGLRGSWGVEFCSL